jgi:HAMP domain-containing protein
MNDEILYAYDDDVIEKYDPEIIVWDVPKAAVLENRGIVGNSKEYQSGKYELREQVLLKDSEVHGELHGRVGERVFEAKRELQHWGEPVGILDIGFSEKPLQETVAESQSSLLMIELLLLLFGLLLSGWVARRVAKPLKRITEEQWRIQDLRLDGEFELKSPIVEVESLSRSLEAMRTSLRVFQIYMPAELVRDLILRGEDGGTGARAEHSLHRYRGIYFYF